MDLTANCHTNCIHCKEDGYFCGYSSISCELHGNIEYLNHPYHYTENCPDFETYSWMEKKNDSN